MTQQEILRNLFTARGDVENRLMDLSPQGDPAKVQQYQDLARKRDQIVSTINLVIGTAFQGPANPQVDAALKTLGTQVNELTKLANTFNTINSVVSDIDQVIKTATQIVAQVAAVVA